MESLDDKLKALGVSLGMPNPPAGSPRLSIARPSNFPIHKVVDGQDLHTPYGDVFVVTKSYPRDFLTDHDLVYPQQIAAALLDGLDKSFDPLNIIFLDTETSGLSGGTGTYPFLIGFGVYEKDQFKLVQLFMRHPQEEQGVIAALNQMLGTTNFLVTFNGKSFDVPLLNTRHRLHGFSPIFQSNTHMHLDMLPVARRIWKNRLPSRSLGDLEKQILNIYRSDEEVPGWMIPDLYFEYLSSGDARAMARVLYHNAMDIISLALLFNATNKMLLSPLEEKINGIDLASIARMFEKQNKIDEAVQLYEAALGQGLPSEIYIQTILRYANIYKQNKAWEKAESLWIKGAELGSMDSIIELAKYKEHIQKDIPQAIYWTQKATNMNAAATTSSPWAAKVLISELRHRLDRLNKKLATAQPHGKNGEI